MRILIIEDNEILSNNVKAFLALEGIESKQLFSWAGASYEIATGIYDAVILDIGLPDVDGLGVCEKIRRDGHSIPVLMLTARSSKNDKISGFRSWADDYMTKPFDYDELLARLRAIVRRGQSVKGETFSLRDLEIRFEARKAFWKNEEIHLSSLEFDLLSYLVRNRGKTVSKEELLEKVWGEYDAFSMSRTVDVYVGYLRKKFGKDLIETVRWQGYSITG